MRCLITTSRELSLTSLAVANLWLTFTIIINLLPDSSRVFLFGTEEITHWVNLSLQWIYAATRERSFCSLRSTADDAFSTVALQFILALGNRPKGEVPLYIFSFCVFAFCACEISLVSASSFADHATDYLLVCAVFLTIKAFSVRVSRPHSRCD